MLSRVGRSLARRRQRPPRPPVVARDGQGASDSAGTILNPHVLILLSVPGRRRHWTDVDRSSVVQNDTPVRHAEPLTENPPGRCVAPSGPLLPLGQVSTFTAANVLLTPKAGPPTRIDGSPRKLQSNPLGRWTILSPGGRSAFLRIRRPDAPLVPDRVLFSHFVASQPPSRTSPTRLGIASEQDSHVFLAKLGLVLSG